ncbi:MAG: hypothetical protein GY694_15695 [Gammaproteobacteria bacterium]|nr:hypothetical protein [Gammaproteobacteria bacterium]
MEFSRLSLKGKEETDWKRAIGFCDWLFYTLCGHCDPHFAIENGVVVNAKNWQANPKLCKAAYLATGETVYLS